MNDRWSDSVELENDPHRAPHAARFNLEVAKQAFRKLEKVSFEDDRVDWYLYFSSTIIFSRAALDALRGRARNKSPGADGGQNSIIAEEWDLLFNSEVKQSPIFKVMADAERDLLTHGQLGLAIHPSWPIDTVLRHGGLDAVFGEGPPRWPDGAYAGMVVDELLRLLLLQVRDWIEEVDARRQKRASVPNGG